MKTKIITTISLFIVIIEVFFTTNVSAMTTGFEVKTIPSNKTEEIFSNIDLKYESEEASFHSIKCFDISDSGLIAIGIDEDTQKHINIYTSDGLFQYGYSFVNYGTYGIEFDNDCLMIYTVRGNKAYLLDEQGNCLEVCDIPNNSENNSYWNNDVFAKSKNIGDNQYKLSKTIIFSPSYSKLTKVSPDGTETVLIDASVETGVFLIVILIIISIILFISILIIINYIKSH
jgi:hypothetical protein